MSDLIVIIGHKPEDPWEWGLTVPVSEQFAQTGSAVTDAEKSALSAYNFRRLIIVIPGQHVVTKLHALGQLSDKQKRQAAGFSIEDELAASLTKSHIALDMEGTRLAVVANKVLDSLLADTAEHGLAPDVVCADYDSFENTDSFTYQGRIIQQADNGLGFAVETNLADAILDTGQNIPPMIDAERFLQKIATSMQAGHAPINFRQGNYAKHGVAGLKKFKRSGLIVVAIFLVFAVGNIWQGYNTWQKTMVLKAQINHIYTEIFPGKAIFGNPALAVIGAQADLKAANKQEFIKLSALLAASTQQVKGVEIASLRYEHTRGQLALSIQYSSFDDVERLKRAVAKAGGSFSESGTRQSDSGLNGDAVLKLKP